jgi:putative DNA primase/helicase
MSNELPRLTDSSGALASRFVVLTMRNSFLGREDLGLYDKLAAELPGIFNWSLAGYDRLRKRGHFRQPETAREAIQELQDLGSPVGAFVRGRCEVGPGLSVARAALYDAWKRWCEDVGREHPGTEATFGRDLRAAVPGLASAQPRIGGDRIRMYEGIGLI